MKQIAIILLTTMKPAARKNPQPSKKYKVKPNSLDKTVVLLILNDIVMELETLKANNNHGKLPYGAISNILASKAATLTFGLFDQTDGVPPFLILDGHGSRFE